MEYLPNSSKLVLSEITNNYILKVNSRDRNILQEPNPFNFKIKFNKIDTKYTIYYEKGYWGSGNKFISNMGYPLTDKRDRNLIWNTSSDGVLSRTFYVNNGAIIEDSMEEVSEIRVTEIVAPRFVPDDDIGYVVNNLDAISRSGMINGSNLEGGGIFLRGIDNTQAKFHTYEEVNPNIPYVQITDSNQNKFFLFRERDYSGNKLDLNLQKNLSLFYHYNTDTLLLNNQIYKIEDISNGFVQLKKNNITTGWKLDFLKSSVRFPRYYCDTIWSQKKGDKGNYSNLNFEDNKIIIEDAEPMILVELVKDSVIEVESVYNINGKKDLSYFKISSVDYNIQFQQNIDDLNANFDKTNQTITITDLSEQAYNWISNLSSIGTTFDVSNCTDTTNQNNGNYTVFDIKKLNKTDVEIKTRGITNNSSGFKADFYFINQIRKKLPLLNLTEGESEEMSKFMSFSDDDNKAIFCKVTINGSWVYNKMSNTMASNHGHNLNNIKFNHLKAGVKDLLNEKLFYLSIEPIVPIRNLITNNKLNNVIGVFYPSTQSKNYIFLTGQNKQKYNTNNLQNLNTLNFKLYYMNGKQVGENLKNYSLDYLGMDSKQTNITFTVEQVRKF